MSLCVILTFQLKALQDINQVEIKDKVRISWYFILSYHKAKGRLVFFSFDGLLDYCLLN